MFKRESWSLFWTMVVLLVSGCAPLAAGIAAGAAGSGTYLYVKGEMTTDYFFSYDKVWAACKKVMVDMHGVEVEPNKELSKGIINAIINNEKVHILINYKSKNVTTVAIRVGIIGNKLSSQLLHDKIADILLKNSRKSQRQNNIKIKNKVLFTA